MLKHLLRFTLLLVFALTACETVGSISPTPSPTVMLDTLPTHVPTANLVPTGTPTAQPTATIIPTKVSPTSTHTTTPPTPTHTTTPTPTPMPDQTTVAEVTSMSKQGVFLPQFAYNVGGSDYAGYKYDVKKPGLIQGLETTRDLTYQRIQFQDFYSQRLGHEWIFWNREEYALTSATGSVNRGGASGYCWRKDHIALSVVVSELNGTDHYTVVVELLTEEDLARVHGQTLYSHCWKSMLAVSTATPTATPTSTSTSTVIAKTGSPSATP